MNTKERILQIVAVALLAYALWSFASVQLELKRAVARSAELDAQLAELQRQNTELEENRRTAVTTRPSRVSPASGSGL